VMVVTGSFTAGEAYVLQAPHVLDRFAAGAGKAVGLAVFQQLIIYDDNLPDGSSEMEEHLEYFFPDDFRSEIKSETVHRIHVASGGETITIVDESFIDDNVSPFDYYKDLMLFRTRKLLGQRLSQLGVNMEVSSVGRFQDHIAFIVGAHYPDETTSQVWIDRETFRPLRWLIPADDFLEIRYHQWAKTGKIWYPMYIEFYEAGILKREIRVDRLRLDPEFQEKQFDLGYLKSLYVRDTDSVPDDEMSEIQKTIDEFRKLYE
jgi:hypothetical protein